ncbi:hypothetical protein DERF_015899 [Dermatophagoides farinae]|uniref:Uncharacterized protein n=2 Tax=Dermatophagoides farinae TaxID=6954 RepID=A0A922HFL9_DERFA|nr:uncharacterized protein LOC124500359 [Dermatophagoides farinae]KAH7639837.1 hypothetical protein HUG17_3870 [Dermatophagoides farinae]KAH9491167.1 hypothetical protein DERF_015899 [Dermatophagoides farinae]
MDFKFPLNLERNQINSHFYFVINKLCESLIDTNQDNEPTIEPATKTICQILVHDLNDQCEEYRKEVLRHIKDIEFRKAIEHGIAFNSALNLPGNNNAHIIRMDPFSSMKIDTGVGEYFYLLLLYNEMHVIHQRTKSIMKNVPKLIAGEWMFIPNNRHLRLLNRDVDESYALIMYPSCIHLGFIACNLRLS